LNSHRVRSDGDSDESSDCPWSGGTAQSIALLSVEILLNAFKADSITLGHLSVLSQDDMERPGLILCDLYPQFRGLNVKFVLKIFNLVLF
jgi:hypothetical protein